MEYSKFSFQLTPSDPTVPLGFETWINDQCIFKTEHVHETSVISGYLPTDAHEATHILKFVMTGKTTEHTKINEAGEIIKDAVLTISDLTFDNIPLGNLINELMLYYHNFNGYQPDSVERFYGTMGCNGIAQLSFTTPIYLWLLENM